MFKIFKGKKQPAKPEVPKQTLKPTKVVEKKESSTLFSRLSTGLTKTRHSLTASLSHVFSKHQTVDDSLLEALEETLLTADVGVTTTTQIIDDLKKIISKQKIDNPQTLYEALKKLLSDLLAKKQQVLNITEHTPFIILVVGVNGAGKTTTIGKLAHRFKKEGKSVLLAAGDTFRAAAIEQLQSWGQQNQINVIAQAPGSDSASVIYDAIASAKAKNIDVIIADTAGRLHTQTNLMQELNKINRVIQKIEPSAPHETLLVLDASIGQNSIKQAEEFNKATHISGIALTKLDGSAKGGIVFAIAKQFNAAIRFIGIGEKIDDLQDFDAENFVKALLKEEKADD